MNPSLPGGADDRSGDADAGAWSFRGRVGYTFIPFARLQQGTRDAPNPGQLAIDVHLATAQVTATAPTATTLDVQLPVGALLTRSLSGDRTDRSIGDLELRGRQGLGRWLPWRTVDGAIAAGAVAPTAPYVARAGAANLPPEASFLTLGRGVWWWLAEADLRVALPARVAMFAQLSARGPTGQASDGYAWGDEVRVTAGASWAAARRWTLQLAGDVQWRGRASEPDPFAGGRVESANAGGWLGTASPSVTATVTDALRVTAGLRVPVHADVVGNQLVASTGAFVSLAFAQRVSRARVRPGPTRGVITVVDYGATWCAPCADIEARLRVAEARWPDVRIVRVDASAWPDDDAVRLPDGARGLPAVEIFDAAGARHALLLGEAALTVVEVVDALRARK